MLLFSLLCVLNTIAQTIPVDYIVGNINTKYFEQVPKKVLIWGKYQAMEPMYMYARKDRGKGWQEPFENYLILELRQRETVFVDYFTAAKNVFYREEKNYEICNGIARSKKSNDEFLNQLKKDGHLVNGKYVVLSKALILTPSIGRFAILKEKLGHMEKHKYKESDIYNLKSIIDDPLLYTVEILGFISGITDYIYNDKNRYLLGIKEQYKKRVYPFVASSAEQLLLMLQARRMHWVDMHLLGEFHMKQLNIDPNKVVFRYYSKKHPKDLNNDDIIVQNFRCFGHNLKQTQNRIKIINEITEKARTNYSFWQTVLKNYATQFALEYIPPESFFDIRENFSMKKELESGVFDPKY